MIIDASGLLAFAKKIQVSHSTEKIGVSQKFNFFNFNVCLLSPHRKKSEKWVLLQIDDTLILLVVSIRGKEKKFIGSSFLVNRKIVV